MRSHDRGLGDTKTALHSGAKQQVRVRELSWEFPRDTDAPMQKERPRADRKWEPWRRPATW
jgi:hypothetical protein